MPEITAELLGVDLRVELVKDGDMRKRAVWVGNLCAVLVIAVVFMPGPGSARAQTVASNRPRSRTAPNVIPDAEWKRIAPVVSMLAQAELPESADRLSSEPELKESAYITGDGAPTALVDVGGEGASTDAVAAIRIERGEPVLARFLKRDGSITSGDIFVDGGSVMHSDEVHLFAGDQAIYTLSTMEDETGEHLKSCKVEAYRRSPKVRAFEWDQKLAGRLRRQFCGMTKAAP